MKISFSNKATSNTVVKVLNSSQASEIIDFEAKAGETTVRYNGSDTVIYLSLGDSNDDRKETLRAGIASVIRIAQKLKRETLSIELLDSNDGAVVAESAILGSYIYDQYKEERTTLVNNLELVGNNINEESVSIATKTAESVCYSRDLVNENAAIVTPEYLADEALDIAKISDKITVEILDESEIVEKGLGLLWAVGKGSATPPRLIILSYKGSSDSKTSAVIGKGLTFDSGGYNLKPTGSMEDMRMDMAGGSAALGIMRLIATLEPELNIVVAVPSAQSAIGKDAFVPGDVYKGYSGKTVEVLNTDAEGRLILADAIAYVVKNYKPSEIIDMATLTGAVLIALGDTISGIFGNSKDMANSLYEAGEEVGDSVWELPIRKEHREAMKSDIADLQNISKIKRNASSITAAAFLEYFVDETPWTHIDIAGTGWNSRDIRGINPKFATGMGVRLVSKYLGVI